MLPRRGRHGRGARRPRALPRRVRGTRRRSDARRSTSLAERAAGLGRRRERGGTAVRAELGGARLRPAVAAELLRLRERAAALVAELPAGLARVALCTRHHRAAGRELRGLRLRRLSWGGSA